MKEVKLTRVNGALKVDIDGEIIEPLSFKSFRPTKRNISDFYKAGVKLFSILTSGITCALGVPYSLYGESWVGDHKYDFAPIDNQIDLFIENAPDCYFALMIQLDTRPWWLEMHPEAPYSFTNLSQVIGYDKWREDARDYLLAVINHVEEKYGERFYGYFMLCGFTTEWFSHFDEEAPHPLKEAVYKKYSNDENITLPTLEELNVDKSESFLPKERKDKLMHFRKFHAELISDSLLYFASAAQTVLQHKKLLGVYFGYLFELDGPRLWNDGHLAYEKVFTSPDIDMISSPSAYGYRAEDSTSAFMVTYDTLDKHNKLYYLEFDHITNLAPPEIEGMLIPGGHSKCKSLTQALNLMQRDFMLCAAKGAALWWFDMFEGWFYSDEMMGAITHMIDIQKDITKMKHESVAEILVIAEGDSLYGVNKNAELNTLLLGKQRNGLNRMGAPYDIYSICDVDKIDIDKYKLVILLDEFNIENTAFINKLKANNRTILWIYAPDYINNGIKGIKDATGINVCQFDADEASVKTPFGDLSYNPLQEKLPKPLFYIDETVSSLGTYNNTNKTAIGMKKFDNWTSIYSAIGDLSGSVLRDIAKKAGVRIYCDDDTTPVYISNILKGVYALEDAVIYVDDGEYCDLFTGATYTAENGKLYLPKTEMASKLLVKKG